MKTLDVSNSFHFLLSAFIFSLRELNGTRDALLNRRAYSIPARRYLKKKIPFVYPTEKKVKKNLLLWNREGSKTLLC